PRRRAARTQWRVTSRGRAVRQDTPRHSGSKRTSPSDSTASTRPWTRRPFLSTSTTSPGWIGATRMRGHSHRKLGMRRPGRSADQVGVSPGVRSLLPTVLGLALLAPAAALAAPPVDPLFAQQWALARESALGATTAWQLSTGKGVVV